MADEQTTPRPTPAELEILRVLWRLGKATVRQVHEDLGADRSGYTTTLKLMQIMADKGLVARDASARAHVFHAVLPQDETQGRIVDDVLDRVFGGSASRLVMHALSRRKASPKELREIRSMIDEFEKRGKR